MTPVSGILGIGWCGRADPMELQAEALEIPSNATAARPLAMATPFNVTTLALPGYHEVQWAPFTHLPQR